mmetsp:Transcript_26950/g.66430  ORF Transcript_26950/g.66430 Transcript_26950/m.66430 type:complete len:308 (+) Transcript_26950:350-1273(+)
MQLPRAAHFRSIHNAYTTHSQRINNTRAARRPSEPAPASPDDLGHGLVAVLDRHGGRVHAILVLDRPVGPGPHQSLAHLKVPELGRVVERSVPVDVLHVGVDAELLDEGLHEIDVAPKGRLVQGSAARRRLDLVHVRSARLGEVDGGLDGAVHAEVAELAARLVARVLLALGLEGVDLLGAPEAHELGVGDGKVAEEGVVVVGVDLDVALEAGILDEGNVRGEHHQLARLDVLVLELAVPLAGHPLELDEVLVVRVVEFERRVRPGAVEPAAHLVAAPERVAAREGDDVAVVEAHAPEDSAQVVGAL